MLNSRKLNKAISLFSLIVAPYFIGCQPSNSIQQPPYIEIPQQQTNSQETQTPISSASDSQNNEDPTGQPLENIIAQEPCISPILNLEPNPKIPFYESMIKADAFAKLFPREGILFNPETADINGPYDEKNKKTNPNGIFDYAELTLVSIVLNNPNLDLSSNRGVNFKETALAWNQNLEQIYSDIGESALKLDTGLEIIFPAIILIGDRDSCYGPVKLLSLASEKMPSLGVKIPNIGYDFPEINTDNGEFGDPNYTTLDKWFAYYGDADGDGLTNLEEYNYAINNGINYPSIALDPCQPN